MWAEARRQEKKIRGIMVDFKKRAERRREYYEKIRQDPTQFLRLHGRSRKINLEQSVAEAAESPATMMPWQGDNTNMIDRFDVRAHLDMIPPMNPIKPKLTSDEEKDERRCNYERYRILVQNEYARISEEQCLKQIEVDETFPLHSKSRENQKLETKKAAIGFTYEDSTPHEPESKQDKWEEAESEESDSSLSDIDLDVEIEVAELTDEQKQQVNVMGERFGMGKTNMVRNLERERVEAEDFKRAKEEEAEKALYSGRKSRRERRALIEKRLRERRGEQMSPPSYAQRGSPDYSAYKGRSSSSSSRSRSRSPEDSGKVTFITSFGGDEEKTAKVPAVTKTDGVKASTKNSTAVLSSSSKTRGRSSSVSSNSSSSSGSTSPERPVKPQRSPNTSRSSSSSSSRSRERPKPKPKAKSRSKSRSKSPVWSRRRSGRSRSRSSSRGRARHSSRHVRNSRSRSKDRLRRSRSKSPPARKARARSRTRSRERKIIPKVEVTNSKLKKKETPSASISSLKANTPKALTPQEKMKLRMQKALNKQHKADKIKEIKKKEEKYQAEQDREEELQERMWKMRKREREKEAKDREEEEKRRRKYSSSSSSQSSRENTPDRKYSKQSDRKHSSRYSRSSSSSSSRSPSPHRSRKR